MKRLLHVAALLAASSSLAAEVGPEAEPPEPPFEVGLEERLRVQIVLVDFVALDSRERTVSDLEAGELTLLVDGREMPISSLDRGCPSGAAEEPRAGSSRPQAPASAAPAPPRQIVMVFDYYHMDHAAETYDRVLEALDRWAEPGDRHMIVALGDVVRVESAWTEDLDEVRRTLARMHGDVGLYGGNYSRLTEWGFFERIEMLFDLLEREPGRKTIVLFSGPFVPDGFYHDPAYRRLSAMSTIARSAVYPVDTGGLRTPIDAGKRRLGGPEELLRLAHETGGRMTADTNDIGLAYARAQRDLSCTYTLGFHDPKPRPDDRRRLTIHVARRGVRIVYPEFYVVRSDDEKRRSLEHTAVMTPQMFASERMRAELFVLGPRSARRWSALVAVELRPDPAEPGPQDGFWTVKGLVRKPNGTLIRSFERRVAAGEAGAALSLYEEISLPAGRYTVSAVVVDSTAVEPLAAVQAAEVTPVPRGEPFLVGPLLGRSAAAGAAFEPLLVAEAVQGAPLESRTLVCVSETAAPIEVGRISREVLAPGGGAEQTFEPASARLDGTDGVSCRELIDRVETASLAPGRYELVASAQAGESLAGSGAVEFTILPRP